ncbi:MAG: hypothetical protein IT236_11030 [Bacteroidia bacterium]|nr:hypothetical protein [Bacteroidia bacterium]
MTINPYKIFSPAQEITDPKWFAGRVNNIDKALTALSIPGSCLMVFGDRGIGKTSFVEMIKRIVSGDTTLLYKYDFHKRYQINDLRYSWISVECNHDMSNINKVLHSLITSPNGIKKFIDGRVEKEEKLNKGGVSIAKIFSDIIGVSYNHESKQVKEIFTEENAIELFSNLIIEIDKKMLEHDEGLLIIIDEFDVVEDKSKFASLIKTLSKNKIKFLISGIAESYDMLISSHTSIQRNLANGRIKIEPMTIEEITDLFNLASQNNGNRITFNKQFLDLVFNYSQGHPYFVQLFGLLAVKHALEKNETIPISLNGQNLKSGLKSLIDYDPEKENVYINFIGNNPEKEMMLKLLSADISRNISQKDFFAACLNRNIRNPKGLLASLLAFKSPVVIRRLNTDYINFTDPMFKIYANSRKAEFLKKKDGNYYLG